MSDVERPDIEAIKALADSATAGDWSVCESEPGRSGHRMVEVHSSDYLDSICQVGEDWARNVHDDAAFIAAARTAVPQMAAYIEALEAELRIASRIAGNLGCETLQLRDKPDDTVVSIGQWTEPVPGWMQVFDAGVALKASDIREAWAFHERWRHLDKDAAGDAR